MEYRNVGAMSCTVCVNNESGLIVLRSIQALSWAESQVHCMSLQ